MGKNEFKPMFPLIEKSPKVFKPAFEKKGKRFEPLADVHGKEKFGEPLDIEKLVKGAEELEEEERLRYEGNLNPDEPENTTEHEAKLAEKTPKSSSGKSVRNLRIPKTSFMEESSKKFNEN